MEFSGDDYVQKAAEHFNLQASTILQSILVLQVFSYTTIHYILNGSHLNMVYQANSSPCIFKPE